jgi:predicted nuclease of predicted toxin-antitoxin system
VGAGRGVRLLLDENISRRLVPALQSAYPGTTQVAIAGLERVSDREIWDYAKNGDYVIVTKDEDFLGLLSLLGYPPKVVLLTLGNCTNQRILDALINTQADIYSQLDREDVGLVEVY